MGGRDHLQSKIFYFFVDKKHRENAKSTGKRQGKHREFCLDGSVATLSEGWVCLIPGFYARHTPVYPPEGTPRANILWWPPKRAVHILLEYFLALI